MIRGLRIILKKRKKGGVDITLSNERISAETCQKQNLIIPVQWTLIIVRDQKPLRPFKGFTKVSRNLVVSKDV